MLRHICINNLVFVCASFGINCRNTQLIQLLYSWWNLKTINTVSSFITKVLPQIILWELWRSRCANKYGEELLSIQRSVVLIGSNLSGIVKQRFGQVQMESTWKKLQDIIDQPINFRIVKIVRWSKPLMIFYKLYSDRSCMEGSCGAGGVIRDHCVNFIVAYSFYMGKGTSNWAEGQAMLIRLQLCTAKRN